jgi:hypothetical protein
MRLTRRGALVMVLLLGAVALIAGPAQASWWDTLSKPKTVSLAKIIDDPNAFKAVPVNFVIQFHETTGFFNPFFTNFTPERYLNFSAWGEKQALWMPEDFANSHPLFFVAKSSPHAATILKLAPFARLRVKGVVTSTFMGKAWIDIREVKAEGTSLTSSALGHIIAGDKLAMQDRHNAAIQHYMKAYGDKNLPDPARAVVAGKLGRSYVAVQKPLEAQKHLGTAIKLDPEDEESKALLNRVTGHTTGEAPAPSIDGETPIPEPEAEGETFDTPKDGDGGTEKPDVPAPKDEGTEKPKDDEAGSDTPSKKLSGPR